MRTNSPRFAPILVSTLLLSACGGSGGGGDPTPPDDDDQKPSMSVTGFTISGQTEADAVVTINGHADEDSDPSAYSVQLASDDPSFDSISDGIHPIDVEASDAAGNITSQDISITIVPSP